MRVNVTIKPSELEISIRAMGQPKDVAQVLDLAGACQKAMNERLSQENAELLNARTAAMKAQAELVRLELEAYAKRHGGGE